MRKNLILVTVLVLFVFNGFGQTIKTFKGELNGEQSLMIIMKIQNQRWFVTENSYILKKKQDFQR